MTLAQLRRFALSLPDTTEEPHFDRTSFRVRGKIFITAKPEEPYVHVFVGDSRREPALAVHSDCMEKLFWGGKVVGLRIQLQRAPAQALKELVGAAWEARAPKPRTSERRARVLSVPKSRTHTPSVPKAHTPASGASKPRPKTMTRRK